MRIAATGLLAAALLLSGCSSSTDPRFDADDLADGACSTSGPGLVTVETTQLALAEEEIDPATAAADYEQVQNDLLAVRESADAAVGDPIRALVTSMGLFRIGAAAGTTNDAQTDQLRGALDDVLTACGVDLDQG